MIRILLVFFRALSCEIAPFSFVLNWLTVGERKAVREHGRVR